MTLSQTKTVVTTGHGHQDATNASGLITFYNASPQEQTIDAGALLTGADNVQVVTDQTAYLPSSVPPTETQVTVSAHVVNPGGAGNIKAGDITGTCCRENIFVSNAAFSGGQDERNYHMVTQQDIQGVVSSLVPAATQMIIQSFEKQGRPTETLIPPVCSQNIITNHQLGEAATTVTVTLKTSCLAGAYDRNDYASQVIKALSQQAGKGYALTAYLPLSPVQATLKQQTLALRATYQATLLYHFSQAEQSAFLGKIKGKSSKQAIQILSSLPGVAQVAITTPASQDTLPTDAASIHIVIVHVPRKEAIKQIDIISPIIRR